MKNRIIYGAYDLIAHFGKKRFSLAIVFVAAAPMVFAGATFQGLGFLPGYPSTSAVDVSADGQVIVGNASGENFHEVFRWTSAGGMEVLGFLPGATSSGAVGMSADGSVIAGTSGVEAFIWTKDQGMRGLGFLSMGPPSTAQAISRDGKVIVGIAYNGQDQVGNPLSTAFHWTEADGMVELSLPTFPIFMDGSSDGSVFVGVHYQIGSLGEGAFRWSSDGGFLDLGVLPGGFTSAATAVSADGSIVVGRAGSLPFRWTSATGMELLSMPAGTRYHNFWDMSADGRYMVGSALTKFDYNPVRWARNSMVDFWDVLSRVYGLDLNGWSQSMATGVSNDGMVIVGGANNPSGFHEVWRAEIPPQVPAAGRVLVQGVMDTSFPWIPAVFDPEGDILNCRLVNPPANGQASVNADCKSGTYTAQPGFVGLDSFSYVANDGKQDSNVAIVEVAIVEPTPTPAVSPTPTPMFTPTFTATATPTFTPTPTGCFAQYPITQFSHKGKDGTLTVTFTGNITSHTNKVVKVCPGTPLKYQTSSTQGPVVCKVKNNTTRGSGSLRINDYLKCTDKPVGKDKVNFKVKSGVTK